MQIKQWVYRKFNIMLLCVLPFLYPVTFGTNIYCHVRGYVYFDGYDISSLNRSDLCMMVDHKVEEEKLLLWNNLHWVLITFDKPGTPKGKVSFWYKWGSDKAYINGVPYEVEWGYVLRG